MEVKKEWLEALDFAIGYINTSIAFKELELNDIEDKHLEYIRREAPDKLEEEKERLRERREKLEEEFQIARNYAKCLKELKEYLEGEV